MLHVLSMVQHRAIPWRPHVDLGTPSLHSCCHKDRVEGVLLRAIAIVALDTRDGHKAQSVRVTGK